MTWEEAIEDYAKAYLACVHATNKAKEQATIAEAVAKVCEEWGKN